MKMSAEGIAFESQQYWDARFARSPQTFDWLVAPDVLVEPFRAALSTTALSTTTMTTPTPTAAPAPLVLHIGCGTSGLPGLLRSHAAPSTILNVDFSRRAVELGPERERETLRRRDDHRDDAAAAGERMAWAAADLLDWPSTRAAVAGALQDRRFAIVIEKSCADAIACGEDAAIAAPYRLSSAVGEELRQDAEAVYIHPVCLLAIHLAALTVPGAMWIALSYSETRFDCLCSDEDADNRYVEMKRDGMIPDPVRLWRMERKEEKVAKDASVEGGVHRPKISHWLYVLRRTKLNVS